MFKVRHLHRNSGQTTHVSFNHQRSQSEGWFDPKSWPWIWCGASRPAHFSWSTAWRAEDGSGRIRDQCWPCWPCWSGTHWPLLRKRASIFLHWMGIRVTPGWWRWWIFYWDGLGIQVQNMSRVSIKIVKKNHPTNSSSRIWSLDIDEGAYRRHIAGSCGICHGFWTLDMDVNSTRQIAIKLRKQAVPDVSRCLNDKGPF